MYCMYVLYTYIYVQYTMGHRRREKPGTDVKLGRQCISLSLLNLHSCDVHMDDLERAKEELRGEGTQNEGGGRAEWRRGRGGGK